MIHDHCDYWSEVKQVQTGLSLWAINEQHVQEKVCKSVYVPMARALDKAIESARSPDYIHMKLCNL